MSKKPTKAKEKAAPKKKQKNVPATAGKAITSGAVQAEMFPKDAKPPAPRRVADPVVDPEATVIAPPLEPSIEKDIAFPPDGSFTAPFIEGSLAHHLVQPESRVDRVVERTFKKVRYPWVSEWTGASDAGDPCIRKLVYQRIQPEAAIPDDGEYTFLFKHGQWVEKEVLAEMAEAGYQVVEQQRPFHDEQLMVKGKIDGKIELHHGGRRVRPPFEVKGYAPSIWERIDSAKDMVESNAGYLKKVPAQVMLYLVLDKQQDADAALIYMKNKVTGKPKEVVVPRDEQYVEWLMRRLKMVREYVQAKKLPPRIEFDESSCGKCPFRGVCLQEMPAGPNPLVLDPEKAAMLAELLDLWWANNNARKAWHEADEKIKNIVRGHRKIIVGDFIVTGNPTSSNKLDESLIPPDEAKKYRRDVPGWKKTIINVKDQKGTGVTE